MTYGFQTGLPNLDRNILVHTHGMEGSIGVLEDWLTSLGKQLQFNILEEGIFILIKEEIDCFEVNKFIRLSEKYIKHAWLKDFLRKIYNHAVLCVWK